MELGRYLMCMHQRMTLVLDCQLQDHYENIYAVVKGQKVFTLLPPSDAYRIYYQCCPVARYKRDEAGTLMLQPVDPPQVRVLDTAQR